MAVLGELSVILTANAAKLKAGLASAGQALDRAAAKMTSLGTQSATLALSLGGIGIAMIKAASDADATMQRFRIAFGTGAAAAFKWANETARATHRSAGQMQEFASSLKFILDPLVEDADKATELSFALSKLAVDLASFGGTSDDDAFDALRSAITGNARALKGFGITMSDAALDAFALQQGMGKTTSEMTESEKVLLRYNFLLDRTAKIQGHAERNSGSWSNQLKALRAKIGDLAEDLGGRLIPFATEIVERISRVSAAFGRLDNPTKNLILKVAVIVAALATLGTALIPLGAVVGVLASIASAASGVALPIAAFLAMVFALVAAFGAMKQAWDANFLGIKTGVEALKSFINELVERVIDLAFKMVAAGEKIWDAFKKRDFKNVLEGFGDFAQAHASFITGQGVNRTGTTFDEKFAEGAAMAGQAALGIGRKIAETIGPVLKEQLGFLKSAFATGAGAILELVPEELKAKVSDIFEALFTEVGGLVGKIGETSAAIEDVGDAAVTAAKQMTLGQKAMAFGQGAMEVIGPALNTGMLGNVISGATQGAQVAGPWGALGGAVAALLTSSEAFQEVMEIVNGDLAVIANVLGESMKPLIPLMQMGSQMLRPFLALFAPLVRLIAMLNPSFIMLNIALRVLTPVLKVLFDAIRAVAIGILKAIKKVLSAVGARSKAVNEALDDLKDASWDGADAVEEMGDAAEGAAEALTNVPEGFKVALARFRAMTPTHAPPGDPTDPHIPPDLGPEGEPVEPIDELHPTSVSTGQAATSGSGGARPFGTVFIESLQVVANDPEEFLRKLQRVMERKSFHTTGSLVPVTSPFATGRR